jgi:O-antigen ligase
MKDILKYSIWVGIYAVLAIPFIVGNSMFFPYITGKAFTFRIIVEIILGLWLVLIIKDEEYRPKWSWILAAAGLFTFFLLIADINAVAPFKAFWSNFERMEGWVTFIHLFAYFAVLGSMLNTEKLWLWFLRINISAGVILALSSIDKATEVRFSGPLGNPIYIAVYFLFIFFFTLILLYKDVLAKNLTDWKLFQKVFANFLLYVYLLVASLSMFVVYRTSRGALLGLIGGVLVTAVLIAIFEKERKVIKQISLGGIIAVIILVVGFLNMRESSFVQNNPTLKRFAEVSWSNLNGQARQLVWPMAIKGFQEKPILGWGQDGFNYVFNKYYDPGMYAQETWFDRAHNAPLDFLVAGGILGFVSYLSLFGAALYLLWLRKNPSDRSIRVGKLSITERSLLTGLFAGYLFQAIFVFDNLVSYIMFFTTLAYVHSRMVENEESKPAFRFISAFVSDKEYQNYILIPVVIILTAIGIYFINMPGIFANQTLIQALRLTQGGRVEEGIIAFKQALSYKSMGDSEIREQLLSLTPSVLKAEGIDQNTKREFLTLTVSEIEKQIARVPDDARYYILMGSLLNNIGNPEQALVYINKAIELSPLKQAMRFEKINALYNLGRKEEALIEARAAYELDIRYNQAKSLYDTLQNETIK